MYRNLGTAFGGILGLTVTYLIARAQTNGHPWELDVLLGILIVLSLFFLVYALAVLATTVWRYFHAVEVMPGKWYFRFWPHEQIAQASGITVRVHEWAGVVKVKCRAQLDRDEVVSTAEIPAGSNGEYGPAFRQEKVDLRGDPNEGDTARLVVNAWSSWWRGAPSERVQTVKVGITDHRPAPIAQTPEQVREAIARINPLIEEAQEILDACGRPQEQMRGADPMYFHKACIPRINQFARDASTTIQEVAPEYMGKFQNVGNVFRGTDDKPVMIRQVEKWLENLGKIQDELRRRL